jgi:hypothetical protein
VHDTVLLTGVQLEFALLMCVQLFLAPNAVFGVVTACAS